MCFLRFSINHTIFLSHTCTLVIFLSVSITRLIVIINFRSEDARVPLRVSTNLASARKSAEISSLTRSCLEVVKYCTSMLGMSDRGSKIVQRSIANTRERTSLQGKSLQGRNASIRQFLFFFPRLVSIRACYSDKEERSIFRAIIMTIIQDEGTRILSLCPFSFILFLFVG